MFGINIYALLKIIYILLGGYVAMFGNKLEHVFRRVAAQFPLIARLLKVILLKFPNYLLINLYQIIDIHC